MSNPDDLRHMAAAIGLARRGLYTTQPNPMVGCVLVRDGQVIGQGWHQRAGQAHAEIKALEDARERGHSTAGARAYVSLEPCSFHGKTGPCTQALISAGLRTVVYGMEDPNPKVSGDGLQQLRDAGIEVIGPVLEQEARQINPGFNKRMAEGLPFVRVKMAMSLDGRTAMASGESKWITGPAARGDVQRLRARSSAVISGIETVLRDDPTLNVRAAELGLPNAAAIAGLQPLRVILDSNGRLPASARTLNAPGRVLLVNAEGESTLPASPAATIDRINMNDGKGRIDLRQLLKVLADQQCNEVLVETGATLAGEFITQGLVDEIIIYMAPKLLGSSARPLFNMPLETMAAQLGLKIADVRPIGQDWRITATIDPEA
ncbi:bifunctional diaminohydroxyphosphoribosylaminopyrimidine deaminase/5-amino-6-(5-phosphoribosylamino)uracil reductase RibD [Gilvimarinus sp. F26214L]|uniref:bifunctional diaminohydroxyphosphoribosylaminopyrimidine deaminase/5-amino-6-(5-phosphoribosylamino)uracil reductase RibD n=1 Tax=Gilvimarinus sp. DZF01 TaxID=3461371 RepID=UPI0040463ED5